MSLYGKIRPLCLIQNDHVIGFVHTKLFIEAIGIFIEAGVHDDVLHATCQFVQLSDQRSTNVLSGTFADHTQIGDTFPLEL